MKKILLSILFLVLINLQSIGQMTITGKVVDEIGEGLPGVNVYVKSNNSIGTRTDVEGKYTLNNVPEGTIIVIRAVGYSDMEFPSNAVPSIIQLSAPELSEVIVAGYHEQKVKGEKRKVFSTINYKKIKKRKKKLENEPNTEEYDRIYENDFEVVGQHPLSTFSIDVDNASYTNVRRFLNDYEMPPKDAVRIEEFINYFDYDYPQPSSEHPFAIYTEVSEAPWNQKHQLLHIGLQGKNIPTEKLPPSNLVFLIDVSGSMSDDNKLPLLKESFKLLVKQLRPEDKVAIVVYAGAAGLVLPSTAGNQKEEILEALEELSAGGSTAGGEGIKLAYKIAIESFQKKGNNRVILATDGDFNVGASSDAEMVRLIEEKRKSGVFLTCLGFGMGNYKDSKMEKLADKGNGNYAYIDNMQTAKKVLVKEFGGTLFTIAKDVKLQLEFNPSKVQAYRLIGYENRLLDDEDFNDDSKDAGELGAGHTVTALYEIIPVGVESEFVRKVDKLKYQTHKVRNKSQHSKELLTIKFRYKAPKGSKSKLIEETVLGKVLDLEKSSDNFRFSASVAGFGMLLRDSKYKGSASFESILDLAQKSKGKDIEGYRAEFLELVQILIDNPELLEE